VNPPRPRLLLAVTGTGTEVGKTWVACELITALRRQGASVAARKPAQSHAPEETWSDADRLATASDEDPADVCPSHRRYAVPMAPPMAADALGLPPFSIADLAGEISDRWPREGVDVGVVEGAGGVASPHAHDGDMVDLITALEPDCTILVADAGLGTINAVRLSERALAGWPVIVFLNRWDRADDLHVRNREWLATRGAVAVAVATDMGQLVASLPRPAR
jgi:dethiobiotin synthetase